MTADPRIATDPTARRALTRRLRARVVITCDVTRWGAVSGGHSSGGWIHLTGPGQLGGLWSFDRQLRTAVR